MFCENCGNPMSDTAKFCGKCGCKVSDFTMPQPVQSESPAPAAEPAQPAEPVAPPVQQPVYDYTPSYQNSYDPYEPSYAPKPKKKKYTGLIVAAALAVVVIIGVLLWIFVLGGNDLEDTSWVSEEGIGLVFTDDKNGYFEHGDEGYFSFTYTVDGNELTMRYEDDTMQVRYKIDGDELILRDAHGNQITYYDASNAFECEYCYETVIGPKYIGQVDGYSYNFCEDCWQEVINWLD